MPGSVKKIFYPPEIREYRVDFQRENAKSLSVLLIAGLIFCAVLFLCQYVGNMTFIRDSRLLEYMTFFVVSVALYAANRKDFLINGTVLLYIWICLLLVWSILLSAGDRKEWPTFIFMFFILFLPLLIRDAWGNILLLIAAFAVLFALVDAAVRPVELWRLDMAHLAICVSASAYLSGRFLRERVSFMQASSHAETEAERDGLTGIYNRRGGEQLIRAYVGNNVPGAFLIIDVDDFKHVNDTYGHSVGDETLKAVANALRHCFRDTDVVMRMGGDEFIVYAVGMADIRNVEGKLASVRDALHGIVLDSEAHDFVTASIGCIINLGSYPDYEALSAAADRLLYAVKNGGKDDYKCSDMDYVPAKGEGAST